MSGFPQHQARGISPGGEEPGNPLCWEGPSVPGRQVGTVVRPIEAIAVTRVTILARRISKVEQRSSSTCLEDRTRQAGFPSRYHLLFPHLARLGLMP